MGIILSLLLGINQVIFMWRKPLLTVARPQILCEVVIPNKSKSIWNSPSGFLLLMAWYLFPLIHDHMTSSSWIPPCSLKCKFYYKFRPCNDLITTYIRGIRYYLSFSFMYQRISSLSYSIIYPFSHHVS